MEQHSNKTTVKHKILISNKFRLFKIDPPVSIALGIFAFVVMAGFVWWFWQNGNFNKINNYQNQNYQESKVEKPFTNVVQQPAQDDLLKQETPNEAVKLSTTTAPIIKTLPQPDYHAVVNVFNLGTITDKEFKDYTLALATYDDDKVGSKYISRTFVYYISDNTGKPVAWDKDFFHDLSGCYEDCGNKHLKEWLGITDDLQQSLDFLPQEYSLKKNLTADDPRALFTINSALLSPEVFSTSVSKVGQTKNGSKIFRIENDGRYSGPFSKINYYLVYPFGKMVMIRPQPDFVDKNGIPQLSWAKGSKSVVSYRYGEYAYGYQDCNDGISDDKLESALVQTGKTIQGDPVYEIDSEKYPETYECLQGKTNRYVYDNTTKKGVYESPFTYDEFIKSHPMFYWKHPFGDYIAFVRSDVVPAAERAKPVIYLYPEKPEKVNVRVWPAGGFSKTDPEYGNGWVVDAMPNGVITNSKDGKQYPYLFWEGGKDGLVDTPVQGFVASKDEIREVLEDKLVKFGLIPKERADFLEFWVPKLSRAPFYFITFISSAEIDRTAPMTIKPQPDTVIRILMDYKPLTKPISVEPLNINPVERKGFTVVEWGGMVRD